MEKKRWVSKLILPTLTNPLLTTYLNLGIVNNTQQKGEFARPFNK